MTAGPLAAMLLSCVQHINGTWREEIGGKPHPPRGNYSLAFIKVIGGAGWRGSTLPCRALCGQHALLPPPLHCLTQIPEALFVGPMTKSWNHLCTSCRGRGRLAGWLVHLVRTPPCRPSSPCGTDA